MNGRTRREGGRGSDPTQIQRRLEDVERQSGQGRHKGNTSKEVVQATFCVDRNYKRLKLSSQVGQSLGKADHVTVLVTVSFWFTRWHTTDSIFLFLPSLLPGRKHRDERGRSCVLHHTNTRGVGRTNLDE